MSGHTELPPTPWALLIVGKSGQVIDAMRDTVITFDGVLDEDFWRGIVSVVNSHADLVKALEDSREALEGWLAFAEEELGEFDLEECNATETEALCHKCESSGCINLKIRNSRAALATLTARKVG